MKVGISWWKRSVSNLILDIFFFLFFLNLFSWFIRVKNFEKNRASVIFIFCTKPQKLITFVSGWCLVYYYGNRTFCTTNFIICRAWKIPLGNGSSWLAWDPTNFKNDFFIVIRRRLLSGNHSLFSQIHPLFLPSNQT